ncbi:XRE family transcriptional regulator [Streptomyces sp. PT12]|uniref:XRE family transcriptional regulator n=1 Tax=Streptomyces sp. PT12 TaxID=1510197 RepID=UPI0015EE3C7D|nr:XRE family transcriptional regulator [Streptomyces sp. PT12]
MDDRAAQRTGYPLTIPDALLNSEAMQRACATRNFQEIFRLVNRRTGSSHADIAAAIGKMTSSRVSDIIRGVRGIRGRSVIERVADGFGIPGEILGLPRRPWESSPKGLDGSTNTRASVRGAGQRRSVPNTAMPPFIPLAVPQADSESSLPDIPDSDRAAMDSFRMADRQLGGGHLYSSVTHYLRTSVAPRIFGTESANTMDTFTAAAALTEMAGWMAHDSGQDMRARRHFERALPLAQAGSDSALGAHIKASMSHLALQMNQPREAMALVQSGQQVAKSGPLVPTLNARLYAMEARAFARTGRESEFRRAIDASAEYLTRQPDELPSAWISDFDMASLASEAVLCLKDLGQLSAAANEAERAVSLRTGERARSRIFSQISLAVIRAQMGDLDAACAIGVELLESCRMLGSLRITYQLMDLAEALEPFKSDSQVIDLLDSLAIVNRQRSLLLAGITSPENAGEAP